MTLELGSIIDPSTTIIVVLMLTCCALPFNVDMLCFPLKLDNSTKKPLQNNIGREKDRYQSSVTQAGCP